LWGKETPLLRGHISRYSQFVAASLGRELGLPFEPADIASTTGAFAAMMVAFRLILDVGDEAIISEPAW
jgi:aspartate aminotransferase